MLHSDLVLPFMHHFRHAVLYDDHEMLERAVAQYAERTQGPMYTKDMVRHKIPVPMDPKTAAKSDEMRALIADLEERGYIENDWRARKGFPAARRPDAPTDGLELVFVGATAELSRLGDVGVSLTMHDGVLSTVCLFFQSVPTVRVRVETNREGAVETLCDGPPDGTGVGCILKYIPETVHPPPTADFQFVGRIVVYLEIGAEPLAYSCARALEYDTLETYDDAARVKYTLTPRVV